MLTEKTIKGKVSEYVSLKATMKVMESRMKKLESELLDVDSVPVDAFPFHLEAGTLSRSVRNEYPLDAVSLVSLFVKEKRIADLSSIVTIGKAKLEALPDGKILSATYALPVVPGNSFLVCKLK